MSDTAAQPATGCRDEPLSGTNATDPRRIRATPPRRSR